MNEKRLLRKRREACEKEIRERRFSELDESLKRDLNYRTESKYYQKSTLILGCIISLLAFAPLLHFDLFHIGISLIIAMIPMTFFVVVRNDLTFGKISTIFNFSFLTLTLFIYFDLFHIGVSFIIAMVPIAFFVIMRNDSIFGKIKTVSNYALLATIPLAILLILAKNFTEVHWSLYVIVAISCLVFGFIKEDRSGSKDGMYLLELDDEELRQIEMAGKIDLPEMQKETANTEKKDTL